MMVDLNLGILDYLLNTDHKMERYSVSRQLNDYYDKYNADIGVLRLI